MSIIKLRLFSIILLAMAVFMQSACKKGWLDVNYNPQEITDSAATPNMILTAQLLNLKGAFATGLHREKFYNWMGYWCKPQINEAGDQYTTYNIIEPIWEDNPDFAAKLLEEKSMRMGQTFYAAIAKVIQAIMWSRNVDMLNNIPYSEAFNYNIRQPKYDSGQSIYEALIIDLDKTISLIKEAKLDKNPHITETDIMYHGEKEGWIVFINTLKLRLLMHQACREDRASYIQAELQNIAKEGSGFLTSGTDAALTPDYAEDEYTNTFYSSYSKYDKYGISYTTDWEVASANIVALNFLKENKDPRIGFFYQPAEKQVPIGGKEPFEQPQPSLYRGNKFGLPIDEATYPYQGTAYVSHVGGRVDFGPVTPQSSGILKGYDMGQWVMTSIESMFLQAEAIYRGWLPGDAEQAYLDAVKESFRWLNVGGNSEQPELSDVVFQAWYDEQTAANNPQVSWKAAPDKYKLLMFQKYMAFNGIEPFEAYVDYRRNGRYPDIALSADPKRVSDKMPIRSLYNPAEYENNADNVNAQGKIDVFNSKIWWMP